jgi:hypothetical protein
MKSGVGTCASIWTNIALMTTGSSMQAITLAAPPQTRQVSRRFTFNDVQSTQVLAGATLDLQGGGKGR